MWKIQDLLQIFIVVLWYDVSVSINYSVKWTLYPFCSCPVLLNFSVTPIFKWQSISKSFVQKQSYLLWQPAMNKYRVHVPYELQQRILLLGLTGKFLRPKLSTIQSKQHCCHANCKTHELSVTYIIPSPCRNFNCCSTPSSRWQRQWLKHV